jgi:ubiquinone/menaquinone biosynthesis C-methylase UbiE
MANFWAQFIRFGFRLLYNEMAFTYDLVSKVVSLGAWRCWQRAALKHISAKPGERVLELAHGTGDLQLDLYAAGYKPMGYDFSPYMGQIARNKLDRAGLQPVLTRGRAQQLPFASGIFASVISTFPTDFIVAPETLREVHRVLQPGAAFVIVPNAVFTGNSAGEVALEWLYRITGQRGDSQSGVKAFTDFFGGFGFEATLVQEACPNSVAQVIIARKMV